MVVTSDIKDRMSWNGWNNESLHGLGVTSYVVERLQTIKFIHLPRSRGGSKEAVKGEAQLYTWAKMSESEAANLIIGIWMVNLNFCE